MPPALIAILPTIAAITGIAGTGVGLGLELSNQPGSPKPASVTPPTPAQQSATQQQEKALISQQAPNVLSQTSGLTNPDYVAQISQLLSGTAGQSGSSGAAQQAIAQAFGLPPSIFSGTGGPTPAVSGFKPAGSGSNTTGSNASTQPVALADFVNQYI